MIDIELNPKQTPGDEDYITVTIETYEAFLTYSEGTGIDVDSWPIESSSQKLPIQVKKSQVATEIPRLAKEIADFNEAAKKNWIEQWKAKRGDDSATPLDDAKITLKRML